VMTFRVSEVESFRQYQQDEEADLDQLLARMRGLTLPSPAMEAGTAFHKALEQAVTGIEVSELEGNGYTFTFAGDFTAELPSIREVRAHKTYIVDGERINISGQLDAIHGKRVEDHKTTGRFDPERYLAGYQWRLYLEIFGADHFRWNVFEIAEKDHPLEWEVFAAHRLEQYRYPGMAADCERLVEDLARFARVHLPERHRSLPYSMEQAQCNAAGEEEIE
jgi:hypothetical protein